MKLCCHWLKGLSQCHIKFVTQGYTLYEYQSNQTRHYLFILSLQWFLYMCRGETPKRPSARSHRLICWPHCVLLTNSRQFFQKLFENYRWIDSILRLDRLHMISFRFVIRRGTSVNVTVPITNVLKSRIEPFVLGVRGVPPEQVAKNAVAALFIWGKKEDCCE